MNFSDPHTSWWAHERQMWVEKRGAWLGLAGLAMVAMGVAINPAVPIWLRVIFALVAVVELAMCVLVYRARRRYVAESDPSQTR